MLNYFANLLIFNFPYGSYLILLSNFPDSATEAKQYPHNSITQQKSLAHSKPAVLSLFLMTVLLQHALFIRQRIPIINAIAQIAMSIIAQIGS